MNMNYGLFPPLVSRIRDKRERQSQIARRALEDFSTWMQRSGLS
jgi:folate-dependent tRNA-U54 methylase TrmFO/GidA